MGRLYDPFNYETGFLIPSSFAKPLKVLPEAVLHGIATLVR
jgi:hypothetical protein